jgi:drug/metabolite transporter (DMT)-like permease
MNTAIPYLGESLSLLAALTWATAVIFFKKSGENVHPIALNMFKNVFAVILFSLTMLIAGEQLVRDVPTRDYGLLLLSGVLGIGISDTIFLKSLNLLGAGLIAIIACLWAPFVIILSFLYIDESMNVLQLAGVMMIVLAVLTAMGKNNNRLITRHNLFWGVFWGVMSVATGAAGIVLIKKLLEQSPILWVTQIRLIGGIITLVLILLLHPKRKTILSTLRTPKSWVYTISGSFFGAYLAMAIWLGGMKFTQASIASALNQTSNIFVFVLAWLFLKEPVNRRRIVGIILGVGGAFLVTFG